MALILKLYLHASEQIIEIGKFSQTLNMDYMELLQIDVGCHESLTIKIKRIYGLQILACI